MTKKKHLVLILLAVALSGGFFAKRIYRRHYFSCTSQYYANQRNISMKAIFRMFFSGSQGIVSITGEVVDEQQRHLALNRQMLFSFAEHHSSYLMQSVKSLRESYDEVDNALLRRILNPFFIEEHQSIQYQIYQQPNGDYAIISGKLPVAYCHASA